MNKELTKLAAKIPNLKENIPLAPFTYIKIGGPAKYFVQVGSSAELEHAVRVAYEENIPFRVLGGGANVLVLDTGFDGLVIRDITTDVTFHDTQIHASAGYNLTKLANEAAKNGLSGLEFAFGIPGTVGGSIYGNAGAFNGEMKDVVVSARVMFQDGIRELSNAELGFAYRHSVLKQEGKYGVVLDAVLQLKKGDTTAIDTLQKERLHYRKTHQPLDKPSLGSVFNNVPVEEFPKQLREKFDIEHHSVNGVVPAGYINDRLELRGMHIGGAQLSEKHGNFIINAGGATADDVLMLVSAIKQKVRVGCAGLELHEEIQFLGFAPQ